MTNSDPQTETGIIENTTSTSQGDRASITSVIHEQVQTPEQQTPEGQADAKQWYPTFPMRSMTWANRTDWRHRATSNDRADDIQQVSANRSKYLTRRQPTGGDF